MSRHRHARPVLALSLSLALTLTPSAHAGDADDTVLLANGGRVRGTVMEELPGKGVTIKLADGTTRTIPAADVKSVTYGTSGAPKPADGAATATPLAAVDAPSDATATRMGFGISAGKRGGSHYGGPYYELAFAHQLPFSAKLSLRTDVFLASSSFDYTSSTADNTFGTTTQPVLKTHNKGTLALGGLRPTLQWSLFDWAYARVGVEVARSATSSDTDPCGSISKSALAYGGTVGAGVRFGKERRAEIGARIDYAFLKLEKCGRTRTGFDPVSKTDKYTSGTNTTDEPSTVATLQLTYLFW